MSSRFSLRLVVRAACIEWMSPSTTRKRKPISALPVTSLFQKPAILPYFLHFSTTTWLGLGSGSGSESGSGSGSGSGVRVRVRALHDHLARVLVLGRAKGLLQAVLRRQAHVGAQVARPDEGHVEPVDGADLVDVLERVLGLDLRGDDGLFIAALVDVLEEAG